METAAVPVAMDAAAPPGGRRHSLLAVIGEIGTEPERGALRGALEREDVAVPQIALIAAVGHNDHDTAASQQDLPCSVPPCSCPGIRSWNINTLYCDLNHQLRLFVTRHLAQFSSEVKAFAAICCKIAANSLLREEFRFTAVLEHTGSYKEDGGFLFTGGNECKLHWERIQVRCNHDSLDF